MESFSTAALQFGGWEEGPDGVLMIIVGTRLLPAFVNIGKHQARRALRSFKKE